MNSAFIHYTILPPNFPTNFWEQQYATMPADIQLRIDRYKQAINKNQLVIGRLLLQQICRSEMGDDCFSLADLQYDNNNKPYWKKDLSFSIAHSKNVIGCAVAKHAKIGLDIELIRQVQLDNFTHILNQQDDDLLVNAIDPYSTFFKLWTIKEAVSKADGRGLGMDVKQVYTDAKIARDPLHSWQYHALDIHPEYACHYVLEVDNPNRPLVKEVFFEELVSSQQCGNPI